MATTFHQPTTVASSRHRRTVLGRRPRRALVRLALIALLITFLGACSSGGDNTDGSDSAIQSDGDAQDGSDGTDTDSTDTDTDGTDSDSTDSDEMGGLPEGAVADVTAMSSVEATSCAFDEPIPLPVNPVCYEVSVPEDWANPDPDDQVVLHVAVFEATEEPAEDAVIYFDGGPGGHTLDLLSFSYPDLVDPHRIDRDFIVFDQRGVGLSEPALDCPELSEVWLADLAGEIDDPALEEVTTKATEDCRDRLESSGVDLTAYNSVASANDVEAIRAGLGYDQLNVIGISYGTRLGQSYMRMYPESVRSIVLDSVVPVAADLWTDLPTSTVRGFEALFDGCAQSATCAADHPNLRADLFDLFDVLDETPVEVDIQDFIDGGTSVAVIDGGAAMDLVFQALYDRSFFSLIPAVPDDALNGDFETLTLLSSLTYTQVDRFSSGMQLSVECSEEIAFESEAAFQANLPAEGDFSRLAEAEETEGSLFSICESWNAGAAPTVESETVLSDVPTLLLGGEYDPITPPSGMDVIADGLSTYHQFTFEHEGHGVATTACGIEMVAAFIDEPTADPDTGCLGQATDPWGASTTDEIVMVPFESNDIAPISGLRPDGWTEVGFGVFTRGRNATDPTALVVQPNLGAPLENLLGLWETQLGAPLDDTGEVTVGDRTWHSYETALEGESMVMLVTIGADGVTVLLAAEPDELEELVASVLWPAAEAATIG